MSKKKVYVIDTNILIDYMDIIQNGEKGPTDPTVDTSNAHLVIPMVVILELSKFKKEKSDRGKAARAVLRRLDGLAGGKVTTMEDAYKMKAPIKVNNGNQIISLLPVHRDFAKTLPFCPRDDDMDGQIIVTAIVANLADKGSPVDGTLDRGVLKSEKFTRAVLLTNDNGLAIRAREYGLVASHYGYKQPEPYTGRRDIKVPHDFLSSFMAMKYITLEDWQKQFPDQPKLVANEFIVMYPEIEMPPHHNLYRPEDDPYYSNVGRYDYTSQRIVPLKYVRNCPVTPKTVGQALYAEALMDPNIAAVICTGPAGSGKTYMATIYGYNACKEGDYIGVTVVPCESSSNLGALPGDLDEKMDPDVRPLKNALRNYLMENDKTIRKMIADAKKGKRAGKEEYQPSNGDKPERGSIKAKLKERVDSIWENWFSNIPIEHARGSDFANELAIYDEFQDQNIKQADMLVKRVGEDGKIVLTGDVDQIHAPYLDKYNNGLVYASKLLRDDSEVAQVHFTEDDVVRHSLVKKIAERQKAAEAIGDQDA